MGDVTMPLDRVQAIVEHLITDGTRDGLILGDELNRAMGASARRRAERAAADRPEVGVLRSVDDRRWIVQIDTQEDTGHITVYINDGDSVFDADPETGEPAPQPDEDGENPPDGIAWRDRNDPIYQTTTPKKGLF